MFDRKSFQKSDSSFKIKIIIFPANLYNFGSILGGNLRF